MTSTQPQWSVGEIAMRKGRFCEIVKIHFEMDPPSVTVRMIDTGDEVNTEFRKLAKADPQDMPESLLQQMNLVNEEPWQCTACTLINEDASATRCSLCETPRPQPSQRPPQQTVAPQQPQPTVGGDSPMHDATMATAAEYHPESDEQMEENEWDMIDNPDDELLVVSWNVWFREDIEIGARIDAILSNIERQGAHAVTLQEVTPLICDLIESSSFFTEGGWRMYGLDVARERGSAYFPLILSRIPPRRGVENAQLTPLTTNMGRYCLSMDFVWKDRDVTIATTQLESREGTTNKYSSVRRSQLERCFEKLSEKRNVIFAGDMNWVDSESTINGDGTLNVPRGWQDVWLRLRGNELGATYDERTNEMIMGMAQHRRDRMFVKGSGGLIAREIQMIGRQPIRGVTFERQVRSDSLTETRHVPVFPSSHYGLFGRFVIDSSSR